MPRRDFTLSPAAYAPPIMAPECITMNSSSMDTSRSRSFSGVSRSGRSHAIANTTASAKSGIAPSQYEAGPPSSRRGDPRSGVDMPGLSATAMKVATRVRSGTIVRSRDPGRTEEARLHGARRGRSRSSPFPEDSMRRARWFIAALACGCLASRAHADAVIDANAKAVVIASRLTPAPAAARAIAIVQVSVHAAVAAVTGAGASARARDAAVYAATHHALLALAPGQLDAIEADYRAELASVRDDRARASGVAAGEAAAAAVLERRLEDGSAAVVTPRPRTTPGTYVPTSATAVPQWPARRPWVMVRGDEVRPGPPPALGSERWATDVNEVRELGARTGSKRTAEQTAIATFWEVTAPAIYWPLAREVAGLPGRDLVTNARFLARAAIAMDDAFIAVFDAKYAWGFWRPVTAIRNGDLDGNDATPRDSSWTPFIETPMHPEYPCAHCIIASTLGTVIQAELGDRPCPELHTTSETAGGAERSWRRVEDFVQEVANARVYDGVHYRNSAEVGTAMGRRVGQLAVERFPPAPR